MKLVLNSITYHDCPVQVREKVAFTPEQSHRMLRQMHTEDGICEAVILDTCNRIEFYVYANKAFDVKMYLTDLIARVHPDAADIWPDHSRQTEGMDVVRHLFEVAAGLDSQMIGENQILAQVKAAYALSLESRMSKFLFHRLFHNAFRVGKAVRTETQPRRCRTG
ncbi:MAG: glutamyl-tRNA reductase [Planctomycetota bacterium]|jgi:glutamyl-tRNA reductase